MTVDTINLVKESRLKIQEVEKQMETPIPTPHVSCMVIWYPRGRSDNPEEGKAAIVTAIQGSGKVSLTILPPMGTPVFKKGVYYCKHPQMERMKKTSAIMESGTWSFPENTTPRKTHYELHLQELSKRKAAISEEVRRQIEAEKARDVIENGGEIIPPPENDSE